MQLGTANGREPFISSSHIIRTTHVGHQQDPSCPVRCPSASMLSHSFFIQRFVSCGVSNKDFAISSSFAEQQRALEVLVNSSSFALLD
jgi:hypothetical protein